MEEQLDQQGDQLQKQIQLLKKANRKLQDSFEDLKLQNEDLVRKNRQMEVEVQKEKQRCHQLEQQCQKLQREKQIAEEKAARQAAKAAKAKRDAARAKEEATRERREKEQWQGEVAQFTKTRVEREGGAQATGSGIHFSLAWHTMDDLDIHTVTPSGSEISYGSKTSGCGGALDIDMNAGGQKSRDPVENIVWKRNAPKGTYKVFVQNYQYKQTSSGGSIPFVLTMMFGTTRKMYRGSVKGSGDASNKYYTVKYNGPNRSVKVTEGGSFTGRSLENTPIKI